MTLSGRHLLCTQDWELEDLISVLDLAVKMKHSRYDEKWRRVLLSKTLVMLFYNTSLRTRISFEAAMTELGGHAQYITPSMLRLKTDKEAGESIKDAAKVMSRYASGLGIRIAEGALPYYGAGQEFISEYAKWADVPVINMANDLYHPCQGLADILGWSEALSKDRQAPDLNQLKHKNFLLTWAHGGMARTWSSVHEALLIASRFGMNITIARPHGYDLDDNIYQKIRNNCSNHGTEFNITDDHESCYDGTHIVYSRNWMSPKAYTGESMNIQEEIASALAMKDWVTTMEKMRKTDNAFYTHCMPIDRGYEVTDEVVDSAKSIVYDVAENRLHVQKAILALTMGSTIVY